MSLILDALKRAERERRAGQTPMPLDSIPMPQPETGGGSTHRWLLPALIGAVVAGGAVYAWVTLHRPVAVPVAPAAAITPAAVAPVLAAQTEPAAPSAAAASELPPETAPDTASAPTPPPRSIDDGRIATLDDLVDDHRAAPAGNSRAAGARRPPDDGDRSAERGDAAWQRPGSNDDAASASLRNSAATATEQLPPFEQPVGPPPPDLAPSPAPSPAPVQAAASSAVTATPPPAAAASAAEASAPAARSFKEMSPNYRAEFPALNVDVHVYNSDPQRRFVILNGKRYHEGETIAEGPRIVGIITDGIVFDWRGERVVYALPR